MEEGLCGPKWASSLYLLLLHATATGGGQMDAYEKLEKIGEGVSGRLYADIVVGGGGFEGGEVHRGCV